MVDAFKPSTLQEALEIRSSKDTMVFAGGSDIMVKYRAWSGTIADIPKDVVFIGHLQELKGIRFVDNTIRIGAAATFSQILEDKKIPECIKLPISRIGSPAIRNLGTIGGNICNSSPAGDMLPLLYALDAEVTVESKGGTNTIGISEFVTGPGKNMLKQDEILTSITIPLEDYDIFYYKKVGQRKANAVSKASFFAVAQMSGSEIHGAKIAFGAVSPVVVRDFQAESYLRHIGKAELPYVFDKIKERYENLINPIDDLRSTQKYRKNVSLQILRDFILRELGR